MDDNVKACLRCGGEIRREDFKTKDKFLDRKYCSKACRSNVVKGICTACGKEYGGKASHMKTSKFCSHECFLNTKRNKTQIPCMNCGKPVERTPATTLKKVFCSHTCTKEYHRPLKTCKGCGKEFRGKPQAPNQVYCTRTCHAVSKHITSECAWCGKVFQDLVCNQRKRDAHGSKTMCSVDCRNSYTSWIQGGDGTWTANKKKNKRKRVVASSWRKVRDEYLVTANHECERCFEAADTAHHIRPLALNGPAYDYDNLMAACDDCHIDIHEEIASGKYDEQFKTALAADAERELQENGKISKRTRIAIKMFEKKGSVTKINPLTRYWSSKSNGRKKIAENAATQNQPLMKVAKQQTTKPKSKGLWNNR